MLSAPLFSWGPRHDALVAPAMTDTPPDHLSIDPSSPFFDQPTLERGIGIRFKGLERNDVEEYSMSEGWIRVALGKKVDRRGRPLTIKLSGPVEAYFQTGGDEAVDPEGEPDRGEEA
jgi:hypothetical protein